MSAPATNPVWSEANQRYLMAALAPVRAALARRRREAHDAKEPMDPALENILREAAAALPAPSALELVCNAFQLSTFERDVLLLCAGVELDSAFAAECAAAQGDPRRTSPTFGLALATLPEAHWSALTPGAPLRRWRLVELSNADSVVSSPLRIDERVLHFLAGVNELDERLRPLVETVPVPSELPPSQMAAACRIAELWISTCRSGNPPVIQLCGPDPASSRAVAAVACQIGRAH